MQNHTLGLKKQQHQCIKIPVKFFGHAIGNLVEKVDFNSKFIPHYTDRNLDHWCFAISDVYYCFIETDDSGKIEAILSSTVLLLDQAPSDLDVSYLQQFLALCFSQTGEPSSSKILEHVNSIIIRLVNSTNQTLVSIYCDLFFTLWRKSWNAMSLLWSFCWSINNYATLLFCVLMRYNDTSHEFDITGVIWFQRNDIYWTGCFEFSVNILCISLQRIAGYSQRIEPWALRTHHSYSSCAIFAMYIEASGKIRPSDWKLLKSAIRKSNWLRDKWEQPLDILLTHSNNLLPPLEIKK